MRHRCRWALEKEASAGPGHPSHHPHLHMRTVCVMSQTDAPARPPSCCECTGDWPACPPRHPTHTRCSQGPHADLGVSPTTLALPAGRRRRHCRRQGRWLQRRRWQHGKGAPGRFRHFCPPKPGSYTRLVAPSRRQVAAGAALSLPNGADNEDDGSEGRGGASACAVASCGASELHGRRRRQGLKGHGVLAAGAAIVPGHHDQARGVMRRSVARD